jgi:hypothetical protein
MSERFSADTFSIPSQLIDYQSITDSASWAAAMLDSLGQLVRHEILRSIAPPLRRLRRGPPGWPLAEAWSENSAAGAAF